MFLFIPTKTDICSDYKSQKYDNANVIVLEAALVTADAFKSFLAEDLNVKGVLIVNRTATVPGLNRSHGSISPFVSICILCQVASYCITTGGCLYSAGYCIHVSSLCSWSCTVPTHRVLAHPKANTRPILVSSGSVVRPGCI